MRCDAAQANATGRGSKTVREFLEKNYTDDVAESEHETVKLAVKALLEVCVHFAAARAHAAQVVQSGSKSIELAVLRSGQPLQVS